MSFSRRRLVAAGDRGRVAAVQVERVAGRVDEDRLEADARIERLGLELDAGGEQALPRRLHIGDAEGDRHAVRSERLAECLVLHKRERQVAGLELGAGHGSVARDARQTEDLAVEATALASRRGPMLFIGSSWSPSGRAHRPTSSGPGLRRIPSGSAGSWCRWARRPPQLRRPPPSPRSRPAVTPARARLSRR